MERPLATTGHDVEVVVTSMLTGVACKFKAPLVSTVAELKATAAALSLIPAYETVLILGSQVLSDSCTPLVADTHGGSDVVHLHMLRQRKRYVITGSDDGTLRLWLWDDLQCVRELEGHDAAVTCVSAAWACDRALSGSFDKLIKVWDLCTGACVLSMAAHKEEVTCVSLEPACLQALSGSADSIFSLWDAQTGECLERRRLVTGPLTCISANWQRGQCVAGSEDGLVQIWDIQTMRCLRTLHAHCGSVACVLAGPGCILSGSLEGDFRSWNFGEEGSVPSDAAKLVLQAGDDISTFGAVDMGTDQSLACTGGPDGTVRVWDLESRVALSTIPGQSAWIRGRGALGEEIWSTSPPGPLSCLALNWQLRQAVSGSEEGILNFYDLHHNTCTRSLFGHSGSVQCVAVDWATPASHEQH